MNNDFIKRIYAPGMKLRVSAVNSIYTAAAITGYHETTPNATYALGRTITAAALLASTLKPDSAQSVSIKFTGSGPIREVSVQADAAGNIRGYTANPSIDLTHDIGAISFSKCIEAGFLTVTKDLDIRSPYSGVVPLRTGEIASEIAYYLADSEQTPSAVIIGLKLDTNGIIVSSGGIMIQTLPDTDDGTINLVESNISEMGINLGDRLASVGDILTIISEILGTTELDVLSEIKLKPNCRCGREMILSAMSGISALELADMAERDDGAEVTCTFCRKAYRFTKEDVLALISLKKNFSNH